MHWRFDSYIVDSCDTINRCTGESLHHYWWPGHAWSQGISSHGIYLVIREYYSFSTRRFFQHVITDQMTSFKTADKTRYHYTSLLIHKKYSRCQYHLFCHQSHLSNWKFYSNHKKLPVVVWVREFPPYGEGQGHVLLPTRTHRRRSQHHPK